MSRQDREELFLEYEGLKIERRVIAQKLQEQENSMMRDMGNDQRRLAEMKAATLREEIQRIDNRMQQIKEI